MKFQNYDILKRYVTEGWVEMNKHPLHDLYIYNYSRQTQFEGKWDDITKQTRGLILDGEGNLVAKAFDKFFNWSELPPGHKAFDIAAKEFPIVLDKADGSLGILFNYKGEWMVATRGSFMSDQAIKATEMLQQYRVDLLNPNLVYLLEIVYPENMIVLVYSEEKFIFLAITSGMNELSWDECKAEFVRCEIPNEHITKEYGNVFDPDMLKNSFTENREGYVIKFEPSNYRVKVKFDEYVRLHRLITNFSNLDIWGCLKNDDNIYAFLDRVPDEFDRWVRDKVVEIEKSFTYIEDVCKGTLKELDSQGFETRKDKAFWVQNNVIRRYQGIVFMMMDGCNYKKIIWDLVRPKYQKPFWNKNDN